MESEDVAGLGDDAFWIGDLNALYVLKGERYFAISGDLGLEQAKPLAAAMLGRLPGP